MNNYFPKFCPECGNPLKRKLGEYGKFLGCSNYPECKYAYDISRFTIVFCPECTKRLVIQRG